jgi:hypothetical protein
MHEKLKEKRKLERFHLKVPARIQCVEGLCRTTLDLTTSDICSGGAFFRTEKCLPEGEKVQIDLVLPLSRIKERDAQHDRAHIKLTGTVTRCEPVGMAISFNSDYSIQPTAT